MTSQNIGSIFDGIRNTVAIPITSPKPDSRIINFQFKTASLFRMSAGIVQGIARTVVARMSRASNSTESCQIHLQLATELFVTGANLLPTARASVGGQNFFAQANRFRSDFHELVVCNELNRLFQA